MKKDKILIPIRAEGKGIIGDGAIWIDKTHPDFNKWKKFLKGKK